MLMTMCALFASLFILFFQPFSIDFNASILTVGILVGGTSIFLATIWLNTFVLIPLGYVEQKLVPNLMELVRKDMALRIGRIYLSLFVIISYLCIAFASHYQDGFFLAWFVCLGIALDVLRDSWRRFTNFLNPSFLVSQISYQAERAIRNDQQNFFLNDLDSLAEIGLRSVEKSKLALSTQTLQTFPPLLKTYFDSAKSIGHISRDLQEQADIQGGDASNFIVFYLLQRLELINDRALRERQETVCRQMIMTLGKIIVYCAQFDLSMVSFPTHFLTKFGLKAQQHYFDEVAVLTTSTLLEIAKTILTEIDVTYAELQDPFQAIINGLAALARGTFKKHKDSNIKVLVQPLVDLKALFQTEKLALHRDTPVLIQQINNVLDEFSVLEQVMQALPSIPEMESPESPASPQPTPTELG